MTFSNPTPLRIGMSGTLNGMRYRVAGRVVMGEEEGGAVYYWQEFNLVGDGGESATLVYEATEYGGQWKLFTLFDPPDPMSVQEAASKRTGDLVSLDGARLRIRLVSESRVYFLEGEAPEGVELGDVARYFNAERGDKMYVVSWTGDEVEFYRGNNLPRGAVKNAFGLASGMSPNMASITKLWSDSSSDDDSSTGTRIGIFITLVIGAIILATCLPQCGSRRAPAPGKPPVSVTPVSVKAKGKLDGRDYSIRAHTVMEIAQVGQIYDQHEYTLEDASGELGMLIFGLKPDSQDALFFTEYVALPAIKPAQAARFQVGDQVNIDGAPAKVIGLFRETIQSMEGEPVAGYGNGVVFYGFAAERPGTLFLARWNESGITIYRGRKMAGKTVVAAFR